MFKFIQWCQIFHTASFWCDWSIIVECTLLDIGIRYLHIFSFDLTFILLTNQVFIFIRLERVTIRFCINSHLILVKLTQNFRLLLKHWRIFNNLSSFGRIKTLRVTELNIILTWSIVSVKVSTCVLSVDCSFWKSWSRGVNVICVWPKTGKTSIFG